MFCDNDFHFKGHDLAEGVSKFNAFLLSDAPEIAVPSTLWHPTWGKDHDATTRSTSTPGFDAMFNAFSALVMRDQILFPYMECFDHSSWHSSQLVLIKLANMYYNPIQYNELKIDNSEHGEYPRDEIGMSQVNSLVALLSAQNPDADPHSTMEARRTGRARFNSVLRDQIYKVPVLLPEAVGSK